LDHGNVLTTTVETGTTAMPEHPVGIPSHRVLAGKEVHGVMSGPAMSDVRALTVIRLTAM
jgi:hypothetical protein